MQAAVCNKENAPSPDMGFVRALLHDDKKSFYARPCITKNGWRAGKALSAGYLLDNLENGRYQPKADQYISCNGFLRPERDSKYLRQVNAILIDIDHHEIKDPALRRAAVEDDQWKISLELFCGGNPAAIIPSYVVDTGRGLQIWYILRRSIPMNGTEASKKALELRDSFIELAHEYFSEVLGLPVDTACNDLARVGRIPGTWNSKAGCYAKTIISCVSGDSYTDLGPAVKAWRDVLRECRPKAKSVPPRHQNSITSFNPLLHARRFELIALRDRRNTKGLEEFRHEVLYAFAETAVREYDDAAALEEMEAFNNGFRRPLPPRDVRSTWKSAVGRKNKGYKPYGSKTLAEHIRLSNVEAGQFFGTTTSRELQRAEAREKKAQRNKKISQMLSEGFSYAKIAKEVQCTKQTVYNYVKAQKKAAQRQRELWLMVIQAKKARPSKKAPTISVVSCPLFGEATGCLPGTVDSVAGLGAGSPLPSP